MACPGPTKRTSKSGCARRASKSVWLLIRGNTGTAVAAQETQNTAVQNTTYTESDLVVPVRTYAGQQVVSRQSIDRGSGVGEILMADLVSAYATKLDSDALNGAGEIAEDAGPRDRADRQKLREID